MNTSLKSRTTSHIKQSWSNTIPEEIENIIAESNASMSNLSEYQKFVLLRYVSDELLEAEIIKAKK